MFIFFLVLACCNVIALGGSNREWPCVYIVFQSLYEFVCVACVYMPAHGRTGILTWWGSLWLSCLGVCTHDWKVTASNLPLSIVIISAPSPQTRTSIEETLSDPAYRSSLLYCFGQKCVLNGGNANVFVCYLFSLALTSLLNFVTMTGEALLMKNFLKLLERQLMIIGDFSRFYIHSDTLIRLVLTC